MRKKDSFCIESTGIQSNLDIMKAILMIPTGIAFFSFITASQAEEIL